MTETIEGVPAVPERPISDDENAPSPGVAPQQATGAEVEGDPVSGPRRLSRGRLAILFLLASLLGVFVLFAGWYLITRKPITEVLPQVTANKLPSYQFSLYGAMGPTGVAVNADGSRIYATQTEGAAKVVEFDGSGKPVASLTPPTPTGDHVFVYVAINPTNGDVYVSDRAAGVIYVYSADGVYRRTFDPGPSLKGWQPLGLAFDRTGDLLVTSLGAPYQSVHEFGPDGTLIRTIGKPDLFNFPNGVAVDPGGDTYVTDSNNGRLLVFGPDGTQIGIVKRGSAQGDLALPRGIAIDSDGRVHVADITTQGVQVYRALVTGDRSPAFVGHIGAQGSGDGQFQFPNGVAVDGRSRVYVADWRNNRIQVWTY